VCRRDLCCSAATRCRFGLRECPPHPTRLRRVLIRKFSCTGGRVGLKAHVYYIATLLSRVGIVVGIFLRMTGARGPRRCQRVSAHPLQQAPGHAVSPAAVLMLTTPPPPRAGTGHFLIITIVHTTSVAAAVASIAAAGRAAELALRIHTTLPAVQEIFSNRHTAKSASGPPTTLMARSSNLSSQSVVTVNPETTAAPQLPPVSSDR